MEAEHPTLLKTTGGSQELWWVLVDYYGTQPVYESVQILGSNKVSGSHSLRSLLTDYGPAYEHGDMSKPYTVKLVHEAVVNQSVTLAWPWIWGLQFTVQKYNVQNDQYLIGAWVNGENIVFPEI